ncbi:T9SS type A sorting domain-containing protein [Cesiribacter andamanensis]|uniref:T9SS type A sorting domain-containing protein n=1 Tax=Cesiribacter andamanensis TaxID=649507 RepID=UPI001377272A|nr:T9SS type A sorting domain-containing protein [Cesiribacter andamanensis]
MLLLPLAELQAQLRLSPLPLQQRAAHVSGKGSPAARLLATPGDTLSLPFWDDFSYSGYQPDSMRWPQSQTTIRTDGLAIRPPSWGVITFDGVLADGKPHNPTNLSGPADELVSAPLDLSGLSAAEQGSVWLSFFWQLQGRGERPDQLDSLKLFFLDSDTTWHQVWSQGGNPQTDATLFSQELLSLAQAGTARGVSFFHRGFRFKFQSFNRLNGQFDQWHLDWVYLNSGRSATNRYYDDQTVSEGFASLFAPYTALPISQYFASPGAYATTIDFTFFNLQPPPPFLSGGETFDLRIRSSEGEPITSLASSQLVRTEQGDLLEGQTYVNMRLPVNLAEALAPYADRDSLYLISRLQLNSLIEEQPFFARNDVLETTNVLHDYFAYDDGTAEFGAGLNGRGQRLAYRFQLAERDTLTHISIYFPYYNSSSAGRSLSLQVWTNLNGLGEGEDVLLYSQGVVAQQAGIDGFITYTLNTPQVLQPGAFFIGFEQTSAGDLPIGFDRNTDSHGEVFYSTNGQDWENTFTEAGSLMLRPHFRTGVDPQTLSVDDRLFPPVSLYPNPSRGQLRVESAARQLRLYDVQGRLVLSQPAEPRTELDLRHLRPGLYLLQLQYPQGIQTKRVVLVR